jgi:hypothetical protein
LVDGRGEPRDQICDVCCRRHHVQIGQKLQNILWIGISAEEQGSIRVTLTAHKVPCMHYGDEAPWHKMSR